MGGVQQFYVYTNLVKLECMGFRAKPAYHIHYENIWPDMYLFSL